MIPTAGSTWYSRTCVLTVSVTGERRVVRNPVTGGVGRGPFFPLGGGGGGGAGGAHASRTVANVLSTVVRSLYLPGGAFWTSSSGTSAAYGLRAAAGNDCLSSAKS